MGDIVRSCDPGNQDFSEGKIVCEKSKPFLNCDNKDIAKAEII